MESLKYINIKISNIEIFPLNIPDKYLILTWKRGHKHENNGIIIGNIENHKFSTNANIKLISTLFPNQVNGFYDKNLRFTFYRICNDILIPWIYIKFNLSDIERDMNDRISTTIIHNDKFTMNFILITSFSKHKIKNNIKADNIIKHKILYNEINPISQSNLIDNNISSELNVINDNMDNVEIEECPPVISEIINLEYYDIGYI